jgi:hypothetical protein
MTKKVINCETGEEFEVELSDEDLAQQEIDAAAWAEKEAEKAAKEQAELEAKAALLDRLGITADEAKLLLS